MEEFDRRLAAALNELKAARVRLSTGYPPLHRGLRRLGFQVRPPHYQDGRSLFFYFALWFSAAWGLFMWLVVWQSQDVSVATAILLSILAGGLFGGIMAFYYRNTHRRLGLSEWDAL